MPVNSLLVRGSEPVLVDTGAPVHRQRWLEQVFSLVEPEDVRWIFLSHDDGDHMGGLADALTMCPSVTLVTNFFATERLAVEQPLPIERLRWLEPGDSFVAGDRRMRLVLPPLFDGPTTRGLFDERTGVLWAVDSFAALTTGAVHHQQDLPRDLYAESFALLNSLVSPWHQWLDPRPVRTAPRLRGAASARYRRLRARVAVDRRRDRRGLRPGPGYGWKSPR